MKAYQSLLYSWLVNSCGLDTTYSTHTCAQTCTHMHLYSHMHTNPLDLPIPGLVIPASSTAISTLPLCLHVLLALSMPRFQLWPSRRCRTLWQGGLGHLGGNGEREGAELCRNCAKVKEIKRGKVWTVPVFRGPCKRKADPSLIFQCHL